MRPTVGARALPTRRPFAAVFRKVDPGVFVVSAVLPVTAVDAGASLRLRPRFGATVMAGTVRVRAAPCPVVISSVHGEAFTRGFTGTVKTVGKARA